MPRYDYECEDGHTFESTIHGLDYCDREVTNPIDGWLEPCGKIVVRVYSSPPTIHFKGDGWAHKDR